MSDPVVLERLIDSTPEEAFAFFTEPERLRRWQAISAAVDLRVDGAYRLTIVPGSVATGSFREVDHDKRLTYTWRWDGQQDSPESLVTIELEGKGGQTLVRLTHEGLAADAASGHEEGWNHFADRLVDAARDGDAGIDPWAAGPDDPEEIDPLGSTEATWAVCQQVMRQLTTDHRELPTPCEEFTVHELVEHLMGSIRGLTAMGGGEVPESIDASSAEDYIAQAAEVAFATWRGRGIDGEIPFGDGTAPAMVPVGILSLEFLLHAWDIAQATGQTIDPPAGLVAYVHGLAEQIIKPDNRGPGKGFYDETSPSSDDPMTRLAAFTGRST